MFVNKQNCVSMNEVNLLLKISMLEERKYKSTYTNDNNRREFKNIRQAFKIQISTRPQNQGAQLIYKERAIIVCHCIGPIQTKKKEEEGE